MAEAFEKVCLTGSGKGRVEHSKGRHLFDYESLYKEKEHAWLLGLNLPVIGQEVLIYENLNKDSNKNRIHGTFARRLRLEIKDPRELSVLEAFFAGNVNLLKILKSNLNWRESRWNIVSTNEELMATLLLGSAKSRFKFHAFSKKDFYRRMTMSLEQQGKFKKYHENIKIDFFVSQCGSFIE